jgi:TnpA family transposase
MPDQNKLARFDSDEALITQTLHGQQCVSTEGSMNITVDAIESVDIERITDLEVHNITRAFNSVSHYIRFHGGGEVHLAYTLDGTLLEFRSLQVAISVVDGNRVVLRKQEPWMETWRK